MAGGQSLGRLRRQHMQRTLSPLSNTPSHAWPAPSHPSHAWMAKMRASATSVFCPPLSCFMLIVSPPPKDTWAQEGARENRVGGGRHTAPVHAVGLAPRRPACLNSGLPLPRTNRQTPSSP